MASEEVVGGPTCVVRVDDHLAHVQLRDALEVPAPVDVHAEQNTPACPHHRCVSMAQRMAAQAIGAGKRRSSCKKRERVAVV